MENASKALLMAGGVLISIVIISLLMLMINSLTSYQQVDVEAQRDAEIVAFNQQFEGYNRQDVRGNELYSLINKALDYNERQSRVGNGDYDEMIITVDLAGMNTKFLGQAVSNKLFTSPGTYTFKGTMSDIRYKGVQVIDEINALFEEDIKNYSNNNAISNGEKITLDEEKLNSLAISYDRIFDLSKISDYISDSDNEKSAADLEEMYRSFNMAIGVDNFYTVENTNMKTSTNYRQFRDHFADIYYEYLQFKRGIFKCTNVTYSPIGRVVQMDFEFTGEFN